MKTTAHPNVQSLTRYQYTTLLAWLERVSPFTNKNGAVSYYSGYVDNPQVSCGNSKFVSLIGKTVQADEAHGSIHYDRGQHTLVITEVFSMRDPGCVYRLGHTTVEESELLLPFTREIPSAIAAAVMKEYFRNHDLEFWKHPLLTWKLSV